MVRIFISYRRAESHTISGRIYDRLAAVFGADNVFKDVDDIPIGSDFRGAIIEAVSQCDVLLALIGPQWTTITGDDGQRRLFTPGDFVRLEVETGLQRDRCRVIPVLVGGAAMPGPGDLPDSLRELAYKNAITVRDDPDFHRDMDRLITGLEPGSAPPESQQSQEPALPPPDPEPPPQPITPPRRFPKLNEPWAIIIAALITGVFGLIAAWIALSGDSPEPTNTAALSPVAATVTATTAAATTTNAPTPQPFNPPNPTTTPTLTLTPTVTPPPTATPTAMPQLNYSALPLPALDNRKILDIAAANGQVWFATDDGLVHYAGASGTARVVAGIPTGTRLSAITADETGETVWFYHHDTQQLGRYLLKEDRVDWFPVTQADYMIAMHLDPGGTLWLGTYGGTILQRSPYGDWSTLPAPSPPIQTLDNVYFRSVDGLPTLRTIGWTQGIHTTHRWRENTWTEVTQNTVCYDGLCEIYSVVADRLDRTWFGHTAGVTLYEVGLTGQHALLCSVPGLSLESNVVDLALAENDQALWMITRAGLARLDINSETMYENCDGWEWDTWSGADGGDFWNSGTPINYRLALDESASGVTIWVYEYDTNRFRRFDWH